MKKSSILVVIDEQGNPTIDVLNARGPQCEEMTRSLEEQLGDVSDRTLKPEHAKKERARESAKVREKA